MLGRGTQKECKNDRHRIETAPACDISKRVQASMPGLRMARQCRATMKAPRRKALLGPGCEANASLIEQVAGCLTGHRRARGDARCWNYGLAPQQVIAEAAQATSKVEEPAGSSCMPRGFDMLAGAVLIDGVQWTSIRAPASNRSMICNKLLVTMYAQKAATRCRHTAPHFGAACHTGSTICRAVVRWWLSLRKGQ